MKKKIAHLSEDVLQELGRAGIVQQSQLFDLSGEKLEIEQGLDTLEKGQLETYANGKLILEDLDDLLSVINSSRINKEPLEEMELALDEYFKRKDDGSALSKYDIRKAKEILTGNNWDVYYKNVQEYGGKIGIQEGEDLFLSMLSEREYLDLSESVNDEFSKKTSLRNKLDLSFLIIAVALEVAKGLLYPVLAEKIGYGQSFDPKDRLAHDDKSIKEAQKKANDKFRDQNEKKNGTGKWIEFLYSTVPYDTTVGTGVMDDVNLHGASHRLYTLGHDPILGWIFGTANILTDTVTITPGAVVGEVTSKNKLAEIAKIANIRSYRVERTPKLRITSEVVSIPTMFKESYDVARADAMNLPAAIFAESQHLKSDVNTKMGLPVPVLGTFTPDFAGRLYAEHYDALCFARDARIIGESATISILIDTIIGLVHGLYYNPQKDGSKDLFEVRTRKILLIANTIGTSSNLLFSYFTGNMKAVDIGGLLVTLTHVFSDTRFLLNVKKEFIENKLYEKIERELEELNKIEQELMDYGVSHRTIYKN